MAAKKKLSRAGLYRSGHKKIITSGDPRWQGCHQTIRLNEAQPDPRAERQERRNFFDLGTPDLPAHLKALLPEPEETADKFLIVWGFASRGDCIYTYVQDGQITREYRPGSVVFDPGSLATLRGVPVTYGHPSAEASYMVTPENAKALQEGSVLEAGTPYREYGLVAVPMILRTQELIDAFRGGLRALSTGEIVWVLPEEGTVDGQPYDTRLLSLRYNHLAFVDAGQAGPLAQARYNHLSPSSNPSQEIPMEWTIIVVNGVEVKVPKGEEEVYRARLNALLSQVPPEVQTQLTEATRVNTQLTAERDEIKAQLDELKAKPPVDTPPASELEQRINQAVAQRQTTLIKVWSVLGGEVKLTDDGKPTVTRQQRSNSTGAMESVTTDLSTLDECGLMREAILARRPNSAPALEGKSRDYLLARLDMLAEHASTSDASQRTLDSASGTARNNSLSGDGSDTEAKLQKAREARSARLEGRKTA